MNGFFISKIIFMILVATSMIYILLQLKRTNRNNERVYNLLEFMNSKRKTSMIINEDNDTLTIALRYGVYDETNIIKVQKNRYMDVSNLSIHNVEYDESNILKFDIIASKIDKSEKAILSYQVNIDKMWSDVLNISINKIRQDE